MFDITIHVVDRKGTEELLQEMKNMSAALERLKEEVAETKTVTEGVRQLVAGLAQQIRDNAGDEVAMNQLADDLDAENQKLGAVVVENTPQA